jgi:hypothetical protein
LVVVVVLFIAVMSDNTPITRSTMAREALPSGSAVDSGPLFTDHLGWIGNQTQLSSGLRNFYNATGVRPHVYIIGEIDGSSAVPTMPQLSAFAEQKYSELFDDEAHLLLVFFENAAGQYAMYAMPGNTARSVADDEARDILMDYIQRNYYANMSEEEMFSRAFNDTGTRIMRVTRSPWIPVLIVAGVIVILLICIVWWKKIKAQKNLEAEQTERILNQPLEEIGGDDDAAKLAKLYQEENKGEK